MLGYLTSLLVGLATFFGSLAWVEDAKPCDERLNRFVTLWDARPSCPPEPIGLLLRLPMMLGKVVSRLLPRAVLAKALERSCKRTESLRLLQSSNLDDRVDDLDLLCARLGWAIGLTAFVAPAAVSLGLQGILLMMLAVFAGARIPLILISSIRTARKAEIKRALLDAVDLMAIGIAAGMSIDRAMRVYAERFKNALSDELKKAFAQLDVGKTRRAVLQELSDRVDLDDLRILLSSILQAEKLGIPLSTVLAEQSRDIKTRHRQWAREVSAKAPIKMLFPLTGLILPALFIILLGPVALKLAQSG